MNPTELRRNLYKVLDKVLLTGEPVEILRNGKLLRIEPVGRPDRLEQLEPHPGAVSGDPYDLHKIGWEDSWRP